MSSSKERHLDIPLPAQNGGLECIHKAVSIVGSSGSDEDPRTSSSSSDNGRDTSSDSNDNDENGSVSNLGSEHGFEESPKKESGGTEEADYRDFSHVAAEPDEMPSLEQKKGIASQAKEPTFVVKLHKMLSNKTFENAITWLPHGRSWRIVDQKLFEETVIPLYFRHGRMASFSRQVSGWGFRRVSSGADFNSYYHEQFLRGMPHLCHKMKRLTAKDMADRKKHKEQVGIEAPPDFYAMDRAYSLPQDDPNPKPMPEFLEAISSNSRVAAPVAAAALPQDLSGLTEELSRLRALHAKITDRISEITALAANATQAVTQAPTQNTLVNTTANSQPASGSNVATSLVALAASGKITPQQMVAMMSLLGTNSESTPQIPVAPPSGLATVLGNPRPSQGNTQQQQQPSSSSALYELLRGIANQERSSTAQQQAVPQAPVSFAPPPPPAVSQPPAANSVQGNANAISVNLLTRLLQAQQQQQLRNQQQAQSFQQTQQQQRQQGAQQPAQQPNAQSVNNLAALLMIAHQQQQQQK